MSLTAQQSFTCNGCSKNDKNVYVDDILKTLISFLRSATCLTWVRSHENIDRPDLSETGERMGQYGLIEIISSERIHTRNPVVSTDDEVSKNTSDNLRCYEINTERELTAQLNIYREQGAANRNQESSQIIQPVGAGIDHLERLIDIYQIPRIKNQLIKNGIVIKEFSRIEWNKEIVNNTWENIGEMQITLTVCATSSIADANIKCIIFEICGNDKKELCEPEKPNEEC